ncbi:hypothetical protein D3C87_1696620 [compost metagenome]
MPGKDCPPTVTISALAGTTSPDCSSIPVTRPSSTRISLAGASSFRVTPSRTISRCMASTTSVDLSDSGKMRPPRSRLVLTPRSSKKRTVSWVSKRDSRLHRKRPPPGYCWTSSLTLGSALVMLQRPLPEMTIL